MARNDAQRLKLLDTDTGEEIDGGKLIFVPKRARIREAWFMAFADGFEMIAKKKLSGEAMRVLMFLLSRMDFENHIWQRQKQVAEALSMHRTSVSRAVKELCQAGILSPKEEGGWTLSYDVAWRGRVSNLRSVQSQDLKAARAPSEIEDLAVVA